MSDSKSKTGKSTKFTIRQRRVFSEAFKRAKVIEITAGKVGMAAFCRLWSISPASVYRWIYRYSPHHQKGTTMVIQQDSEAAKTLQLQQRVADLERILGQKQLIIDYQEKLIELASKELNLNLKKNFGSTP
jgi:transposase-like protein